MRVSLSIYGKELNDELGLDWYDYGRRNYDTSLGRWMNIDPLAEKYYAYSGYNYTINNPIVFIDPDRRDVINEETARREGLQNTVALGNKYFAKNYNGNEKMKKKDFNNKKDWQKYKSFRSKLNKAIKKENEINDAIADFQKTNPLGFYIANKLTYSDNNGNTQDFDIIIHSDTNVKVNNNSLTQYGGAVTELAQNASTNIYDAHTTIDFSTMTLPSNKLAHELGHGYTLSKAPINAGTLMGSTHNCQDPVHRNSYQSKDAMDWKIITIITESCFLMVHHFFLL